MEKAGYDDYAGCEDLVASSIESASVRMLVQYVLEGGRSTTIYLLV